MNNNLKIIDNHVYILTKIKLFLDSTKLYRKTINVTNQCSKIIKKKKKCKLIKINKCKLQRTNGLF